MPTITPEAVQATAKIIANVWEEHPDFKLKDVTFADFTAKQAALEEALDDLDKKDLELTPLRNLRDQLASELNSWCVRARSSVRGYFGGNSDEYEQVGGTRSSERKRPSRKKGGTPPAK